MGSDRPIQAPCRARPRQAPDGNQRGEKKSGKSHSVELNPIAYSVLINVQHEQRLQGVTPPWVFFNVATGTHLSARTNKWWYKAVEQAQIADFHFHDLRHTTASWLRMTGADLLTVKEVLGHSSLAMTARYSHITPAHRQEALNKLADVFIDAEPRSTAVDYASNDVPQSS